MRCTLYALSTCRYCRMARELLDEAGADYDVIEVDLLEGAGHDEAVAEVRRLSGGTSFPVFVFGDEVVSGLDVPRVRRLVDA